ncbi:MAG TPA: helix-turn-helix transcriptional regulator [Actinokineospora sp.]|jgi:transcriptional regulator with XRE-family HTH domain|nr:helix-turn-helix transcriptional regulator [Actinokineospora sp.]
MASRPSPTVPKRQVGQALAAHRDAAGKSREDAADALECSVSKIGRIEHGQVSPSASDLRALLDLYGVADQQRHEIEDLARDARKRRPRTTYGKAIPNWFRRYVALEEAATEIRTYDEGLITGLLQTEDYARTLTTSSPLHNPADIEQIVKARTARQARLLNSNPPDLWAVMSEAAVRLVVGGPHVMRAQLGHLIELSSMPNVTVQIAPFDAGAHAATGFAFTLLSFPDSGVDVVYLEDLTSASYLDKANDPQRQRYSMVWRHLTAAALSPNDSIRLVDTLRREL